MQPTRYAKRRSERLRCTVRDRFCNSATSVIFDMSRVLFGLAEQRDLLTRVWRPTLTEGPTDVLAVAAAGRAAIDQRIAWLDNDYLRFPVHQITAVRVVAPLIASADPDIVSQLGAYTTERISLDPSEILCGVVDALAAGAPSPPADRRGVPGARPAATYPAGAGSARRGPVETDPARPRTR